MNVPKPFDPSILSTQTGQVRGWLVGRLWAQVLVGLVLGIVAGVVLSPEFGWVDLKTKDFVSPWLALPGRVFLNLIAMVLVPVVVISIVQGVTAAVAGSDLRRVGAVFGVLVVVTTTLAAVLGVLLAQIVEPGTYVTGFELSPEAAAQVQEAARRRLPDLIAGLVPTDVPRVLAERDMTAIVILALMVGFAARQANRARTEPFLRGLDGLMEVAMTIVKWAMFLTPYAVFGLIAQVVAEIGPSSIIGMSVYVLTVIAGLTAVLAMYLALVVVIGGYEPRQFLRDIFSVQLLAFSTSSSAAVMPLTIDTAITKLHVPAPTANVVVPLGATMNMAGTALYQAVAVIFLAQMTGLDLTVGQIAGVVGTLVVSSIGAPGTPGVSVAILTTVSASLGIPAQAMVLIFGVDRILDMFRTVVNVTGDLTACAILRRRSASQLPPEVTNATPAKH
ncbi:MAG: dicarboxylate/amino acid:cation symporter [Rhodobacteraceae bacterium]|nr:dicarboxylate/amino acid:cation symporter [Paracoccaceae bacterium]